MLQSGPAGFAHAPAAKALIAACLLASVFVGFLRNAYSLSLIVPFDTLISKLQLWRLATSQCFFGSAAEGLLGTSLMYVLARASERRWGSSRFMSFLVIVSLLIAILTLAAVAVLPQPRVSPGELHRRNVASPPLRGAGHEFGGDSWSAAQGRVDDVDTNKNSYYNNNNNNNMLPVDVEFADTLSFPSLLAAVGLAWPTRAVAATGPYGIIFALLVQMALDQPPVYRFRICGLPASDKTFVYVLAVQLLLAGFPGSPLPALVGVLAGLLYRSDAMAPIKAKLAVPPRLRSFGSRVLVPLIQGGRTPSVVATAATARGGAAAAGGAGGAGGVHPAVRQAGVPQRLVDDPIPVPGFTPARPAPAAVVPEASINVLVDMGFSRDVAVQTLRATGGDVDTAIAVLIGDQ